MHRINSALLHHPVLSKEGELYTTAITNIDVHDIARSSRTYGLTQYYIVSPIDAQREMAETIAGFWLKESGVKRNPDRSQAMCLISVQPSFEDCIRREEELTGEKPLIVTTSAKRCDKKTIDYGEGKRRITEAKSTIIVFGTGYGLHQSIIDLSDYLLEPIVGSIDYNHLSVRSAAAITLDRLFHT